MSTKIAHTSLKLAKRVYLDTNVYIYLLTDNVQYADFIEEMINDFEDRKVKIYESNIVLLELLNKANREEKEKIRDIYLEIPNLYSLEPDLETIELAANLRNKYNLKVTEALQLATAVQNDCDVFISNNEKFKSVTEVDIISLG